MNRRELTLAVLAAAEGMPFTPVQLQKALFLIVRNMPTLVDDGESFNFVPYDYGPFDSAVYQEAAALSRELDVAITPAPYGRFNQYAATAQGLDRGRTILDRAHPTARDYISRVSTWVRNQSFGSLVKSIYDQYPEMRVNSIFQG